MSNEIAFAVYGCGGTGINLTGLFNVDQDAGCYPKVTKYYLDSSDANKEKVPDEDKELLYQLEGMRGAGGKRQLTHSVAVPKIDKILIDFKPGNVNAVIFGAAGGTGNVIGALIATELLRRRVPVICFVVGSIDSGKWAENTLGTLKTLQQLAAREEVPIAISYYQNQPTPGDSPRHTVRKDVDRQLLSDLTMFALIASEKHAELDRQDIANWIHYQDQCSVPAQLTDVMFVSSVQRPGEESRYSALRGKIISSACLLLSDEYPVGLVDAQYETFGFYSHELIESLRQNEVAQLPPNLYLGLTNSVREARLTHIKEEVERYNKNSESFADNGALDDDDDTFVF